MNRFLTGVALLSACATAGLAQANNKLEEVVVTSSRVAMPLRQIGTAVSVVTAQDIENLGVNGIAGILRTQPSISISNNGGVGATTALRIRGEEGFRTLVLLDGMDISDVSSPQVSPNFENLLSSGVSRVEILRGPQGMMYGADAGGVVNIQSYQPQQNLGGELSAEAGRYATRQFAGSIGGKNKLGDFSLLASDFQTRGYNSLATDTQLADDDGYDNTSLHGRVAWNASAQLRLQLTARTVDADNDYDSCFSNADFSEVHDCNNTFEQRGVRLAMDYSGERLQHSLAYSNTDSEREFFSEGESSFGFDGELEKVEYLGSFAATESTRLVYGADLKREAMSDGFDDEQRDQAGLYFEYQGGFADQLYVTAGARYDDNDDFGDFTSVRVSAAYLLETQAGTVKFKSSYGTGFRAPSLYEVAYNQNPFAYPPASETTLQEEQSQGFDLGVEYYTNAGMHLEAVFFDQAVDREIYFDSVFYSGYLQESGATRSRGLELIAELPLSTSWQVNANYTYNDTRSATENTRIRRPRHLANVHLAYVHADGKFRLQLNAEGSYDAVEFDGSELDDYTVLNLSANYMLSEGLQVYGRVENLLDQDYQQVPTYNTSAAAGYAGVRYSF